MEKSFSNYLEKLGTNFLVSAMVPSLALVIASVVMLNPILNVALAFQDSKSIYHRVGFGVFLFIITVIIGFTLTALNTFILKMFEGYVIFPPLRFLYDISREAHKQRARELKAKRERLESKIHGISRARQYQPLNRTLENKFEDLMGKYYDTASSYDQNYPEDEDDILPTRFGNTLKAAENYAGARYGLDSVNFFPRLVHVIPLDYKSSIDATRNELSFLVNMSILSVTFSGLCICAFFYAMWKFNAGSSEIGTYSIFIESATRYLIAAALGFLSCGFFYNASLFSVGSFGLMIRSSYDLFRLDLLKKFGFRRPRNFDEEYKAWQNLNEFIVLGDHSLNFENMRYREKE